MRTTLFTLAPSPYQVELFDELAKRAVIELKVIYVCESAPQRLWKRRPRHHEALILGAGGDAIRKTRQYVENANIVVFQNYSSHVVRSFMKTCEAIRKPWCFWGEKPGYLLKGWIGSAIRRARLRTLLFSRAPIWGIGEWGVAGYRNEFGSDRLYFNVPYFSDLERFRAIDDRLPSKETTLLFSGALIKRKGVGILCSAFRNIAHRRPTLRLEFLGDGPLRKPLETALSGFNERVTFHGFKDWDDLPRTYSGGTALCAPSLYDGWGLIVPEGLASGMPVIASDHMGSAREMIRPGQTGWLVESGSVSSLEMALLELVDTSGANLARMAEHARIVSKRYDIRAGAVVFEEAVRASYSHWQGH